MQQWLGRGYIFNLLIDINNSRFRAFVYMLQECAHLDSKSALCPEQQKHVTCLS